MTVKTWTETTGELIFCNVTDDLKAMLSEILTNYEKCGFLDFRDWGKLTSLAHRLAKGQTRMKPETRDLLEWCHWRITTNPVESIMRKVREGVDLTPREQAFIREFESE